MHEVTRARPLPVSEATSKFFQFAKIPQNAPAFFRAHPGIDSKASLVHHFGVGTALLNDLEKSAPRNYEVERFTDVFFDTPNRQLAFSGIWLRRRSHESRKPVSHEWSLKVASVTSDPQVEELLSVDETKDKGQIELYLQRAGLPRLPDSELTMYPLVIIDFARFTVPRKAGSNVWVDCTRIGTNYYVLGGCSFRDVAGNEAVLNLTSPGGVDHPGYFAPVRTKVIEAIRHAHPELYKELIDKRVIPPDAHYLQAHAYTQPPDCFATAFIYDDDDN